MSKVGREEVLVPPSELVKKIVSPWMKCQRLVEKEECFDQGGMGHIILLSQFHPWKILLFIGPRYSLGPIYGSFSTIIVHSHAIEVGWSVQVHFGGGLLKTTSFVWIYLSSIYFQARLLSNIIIKCPSMVFCWRLSRWPKGQFGQRRLQLCFLLINFCIRLCHPNKTDNTYLLV